MAVVGWAAAISLAGFARVYWLAIVLLALAGDQGQPVVGAALK